MRPFCLLLVVVSATSAHAADGGTPAVDTLEGTWRGVLGGKLHLALTVQPGPAGQIGVIDSIDQGVTLLVDRLALTGDSLHLEITRVSASFDGKLDASGKQLSGTWTQGGAGQPLTFSKDAARAAVKLDAAKKPLDAPIDLDVPWAPVPLFADDRTHLVYELSVTNMSSQDLVLEQVEVLADGTAHPLLHLEAAELTLLTKRPGVPDAVGLERLHLAGGLRAVLFLYVTLDAGATVPPWVEHKVTVRVAGESEDRTVTFARVRVQGAPVIVSAPLKGQGWRAGNGPSKTSQHRRALIPVGGRAHISQRFAIDWIKLGDDGKTFTGDPTKNASYHAYGAEALAVGDGVVTEVKDGIPENVPGADRAVPITLETIGGNHVIVDLGSSHFAFWAHLQPGSVRVKVGDKVKRGQVLGLVGNSGNSTQPHLHFHMADASSPLGAEGIPYAFESFEVRPLTKPGEAAAKGVKRSKQLPTEDEVVAFP